MFKNKEGFGATTIDIKDDMLGNIIKTYTYNPDDNYYYRNNNKYTINIVTTNNNINILNESLTDNHIVTLCSIIKNNFNKFSTSTSFIINSSNMPFPYTIKSYAQNTFTRNAIIEICKILPLLPNLKLLSLGGSTIKLTDCIKLIPFHILKNLKQIGFNNFNITKTEMEILLQYSTINKYTSISLIDINLNNDTYMVLNDIFENVKDTLTELTIVNSNISVNNLEILTNFNKLTNLTFLRLDDKYIDRYIAIALARVLVNFTKLTTFFLNENNMDDVGLIALSYAFTFLQSLTRLYIYIDIVTMNNMLLFGAVIGKMNKLREVYIKAKTSPAPVYAYNQFGANSKTSEFKFNTIQINTINIISLSPNINTQPTLANIEILSTITDILNVLNNQNFVFDSVKNYIYNKSDANLLYLINPNIEITKEIKIDLNMPKHIYILQFLKDNNYIKYNCDDLIKQSENGELSTIYETNDIYYNQTYNNLSILLPKNMSNSIISTVLYDSKMKIYADIYENNLLDVTNLTFTQPLRDENLDEISRVINSQHNTVTNISLNHVNNEITDMGFINMLNILHFKFEKITILNFNNNYITDNGIIKFSEILYKFPNLEILSFANNNISDKGFINFCSMIHHLPKLKILDFGSNNIGLYGVSALCGVLKNIPELHTLYLKNNNIGDAGAMVLSSVVGGIYKNNEDDIDGLFVDSLININLNNCNITDKGKSYFGNRRRNKFFIIFSIDTNIAPDINKRSPKYRNIIINDINNLINIEKSLLDYEYYNVYTNQYGEIILLDTNVLACTNMYIQILINNIEIPIVLKFFIDKYMVKLRTITFLAKDINSVTTSSITTNGITIDFNITNFNLNELNIQLTSSVFTTLCGLLEKIPNLEILDLSYNDLSIEYIKQLSFILGKFKNLKQLNLNSCNLGASSINILSGAIGMLNNLTYLNLSNNNIGRYGVIEISQILYNLPNITILSLYGNNIDDMGLVELCKSICYLNKLERLFLNNNSITSKGLSYLSKTFSFLPNMNTLYLNNNNIDKDGIIIFSQNIKYLQNLEILYLNDNKIGDIGAVALSNGLINVSKLKLLYLGNNNITNAGGIALSTVLYKIKELITVDLSDNNITDTSYFGINSYYRDKPFQYFNVNINIIDDVNKRFPKYSYKFINNINEIMNSKYIYYNGLIYDNSSAVTTTTNITSSGVTTNNIITLTQIILFDINKINMYKKYFKCINDEKSNFLLTFITGDLSINQEIYSITFIDNINTIMDSDNYLFNDDAIYDIVNNKKILYTTQDIISYNINIYNNITVNYLKYHNINYKTNIYYMDLIYSKSIPTTSSQITNITITTSEALIDIITNYNYNDLTDTYTHNKNITNKQYKITVGSDLQYNTVVINLTNMNIGYEGIKTLTSLFVWFNIQVLLLRGNNIGDNGASLLSNKITLGHVNALIELDLTDNNIGELGATNIGNSLKNLSNLIALAIGMNKINDNGAISIANGLSYLINLQILYLNVNLIGDVGAIKISESLSKLTKLNRVYLSFNSYTENGKQKLLTVLNDLQSKNTDLKYGI